jgi:transposase
MSASDCLVAVGVDSHGEVHVAAAVDQLGRLLATTTMPTTTCGYRQLLGWARGLGEIERFGVEGTGAFAAGLLRFLLANGQVVLEVDRPDRSTRRRRGKSDPLDAEAAARTVLAGPPRARRAHAPDQQGHAVLADGGSCAVRRLLAGGFLPGAGLARQHPPMPSRAVLGVCCRR